MPTAPVAFCESGPLFAGDPPAGAPPLIGSEEAAELPAAAVPDPGFAFVFPRIPPLGGGCCRSSILRIRRALRHRHSGHATEHDYQTGLSIHDSSSSSAAQRWAKCDFLCFEANRNLPTGGRFVLRNQMKRHSAVCAGGANVGTGMSTAGSCSASN